MEEIKKAADKEGVLRNLPLKVTKRGLRNYINSTPDTMIKVLEPKREVRNKYGDDFVIGPKYNVTVARINGKVKNTEYKNRFFNQIKIDAGFFTLPYYGKDNLELVVVFYSGFPFTGINKGMRLEVSPNNITPDVYKDFGTQYRLGDLAEFMIDWKNKRVVFFS